MNKRERKLSQPTADSQAAVLASWLSVITDFNALYSQLSACLSTSDRHAISSVSEPLWVGQCRSNQISTLLVTMHSELETMLNDADQFEHLNTQEGYDHLTTHVIHLKQLNHQAQVLLCLASLPTG